MVVLPVGKLGQRLLSAPIRRSFAATDGRSGCDTLTNIQMMKRNGSASAEIGSCGFRI